METNTPKRRDNKKSLRVKVISLGNAEVGKVSDSLSQPDIVARTNMTKIHCLILSYNRFKM